MKYLNIGVIWLNYAAVVVAAAIYAPKYLFIMGIFSVTCATLATILIIFFSVQQSKTRE